MKNFFLILLTIVSIEAYSIPKGLCDKKRICCEEPSVGPFAFSYNKKDETTCSKNTYLYADFLYVAATQNPEYIYVIDNEKLSATSIKYKPGFRIGFDKFFYNEFYFNAVWTYIRLKRDSKITMNNENIIGSLLPPDDLNVMSTASSRIGGDFSTLDVRLKKPYYISRNFISSPMLGIRVAWIDLEYLARYFINSFKNIVIHKNTYSAVGLSASYEGLYEISKNVNFYFNTLLSILFGKFDTSQRSKSPFNVLKYNVESSYYSINPNAEVAFGICLNKYLKKDKYKISAKIGYEFHHWWNQNQLKKFLDLDPVAIKNYSKNNLSFNGFVFGLLVTF